MKELVGFAIYLAVGAIFAQGFMAKWHHDCKLDRPAIYMHAFVAVTWPIGMVVMATAKHDVPECPTRALSSAMPEAATK